MDKRQLRIRDQIQAEYFRVKEKLGRRRFRMDLFTYMDDDVYQLAMSHTNNIFGDYLGFCMHWMRPRKWKMSCCRALQGNS
ncbi:MAG: hypothetical protein ACLUD2_05800 [Clostridium sp.]